MLFKPSIRPLEKGAVSSMVDLSTNLVGILLDG